MFFRSRGRGEKKQKGKWRSGRLAFTVAFALGVTNENDQLEVDIFWSAMSMV